MKAKRLNEIERPLSLKVICEVSQKLSSCRQSERDQHLRYYELLISREYKKEASRVLQHQQEEYQFSEPLLVCRE